jgi:hypothetical protein
MCERRGLSRARELGSGDWTGGLSVMETRRRTMFRLGNDVGAKPHTRPNTTRS